VPVKAFFFILSLFYFAFCPLLFAHGLMLRFCFVYLSLFNVALCFAEFSHRLNVTLVRLN
jgi:hypothetical protein